MRRYSKLSFALLLLFLNGACSDVSDAEPADSCEPVAACSQDQCGVIDDGCGGTVDCGSCACEGGLPVEVTCGPCQLGRTTCESDDTGGCDLPSIPGLDTLDCDADIVYLDPTFDNTPDGSRDAPYVSFDEAFDALESSDASVMVVIGEPVFEFDEPLVITSGKSIVGGYNADGVRAVMRRPTLSFSAAENGDTAGIVARDITEETLLGGLVVTTEDATATGTNNVGVLVSNGGAIRFSSVEVTAGRGGDGEDGVDGTPGEAGVDGTRFAFGELSEIGVQTDGAEAPAPQPGCGDPETIGGRGGRGGAAWGGGTSGQDGESTLTAAGGAGGVYGYEDAGNPGEDGEDGTLPQGEERGTDGLVSSPGGALQGETWVSSGAGADGGAGRNGIGGAGGGGGSSYFRGDVVWYTGPPGATGGSGGCGGTGGTGGGPGGGSFGLLVVSSADVDLADSVFAASPGGDGGAGGEGGVGGAGGVSAQGGDSYESGGTHRYPGGDSGAGSPGADGGHGAGGAGGVSYGVYCGPDSTADLSDATATSTGAASGGVSPGNSGESGISADSEGC